MAAPEGAATGSPAVRTVNLSKRFGRTVALAGLTMTVPRGEVFGFLGPNGAGKTTSVKLLLGLLKPTSGEASTITLLPMALSVLACNATRLESHALWA